MVVVGNAYYLFYSANWWESPNYGILFGYAICDTPRGPCSKKTLDGPLVKSGGEALGPGGQEIFADAQGKLWMAYHARTAPIVGYSNGGRPLSPYRSTRARGRRSVARGAHHDCEATVNARSLMADDAERIDPKGTMETVPPPKGAKDPYSAQTRVATLPEHVLEAMRAQETDASLEKRTKSGMRAAAVPPAPASLAPPAAPVLRERRRDLDPGHPHGDRPETLPARAPKRRGLRLLWSIAVVALFALLGALAAAALTFAAN